MTAAKTTRGTSNSHEHGSTTTRRSRRAWMLLTYAANVEGFCRCYRCGGLLFNPDSPPENMTERFGVLDVILPGGSMISVAPLTIDRIIPGILGGTYRRNNIRPACCGCNSETGGALASRGRKA